jgi:hypothetical protein
LPMRRGCSQEQPPKEQQGAQQLSHELPPYTQQAYPP